MDPLSLAASVAGLTSLGIQVTGGISTYLDALKCRDEELEAIRRQNADLRSVIATIETTASAIRSLPQNVATAVTQSIKSCTDDMGELEEFVAKLSGMSLSTWRLRLKDKSRKLLYPFDRPKINQLDARISQSKATLQLVIGELELTINRVNMERLSLVDSSLRDNATEMLLVRSDVAATHGHVMEIRNRFPRLEARIALVQPQIEHHSDIVTERIDESTNTLSKQLGHIQSAMKSSLSDRKVFEERVENTLQMILAEANERHSGAPGDGRSLTTAAGLLAAKPAALGEVCNELAPLGDLQLERSGPDASQPRLPINAQSPFSPSRVIFTEARYRTCVCRHRRLKRTRAHLQWGPIQMYRDHTEEGHSPYCPLHRTIPTKHRQNYGVRIAGLPTILNAAIEISFHMTHGAGGQSISPQFTYRPTVNPDTDPAFRIIRCLNEVIWQSDGGGPGSFLSTLEDVALSKIIQLFSEGISSPFSVDWENRSLMHHALHTKLLTSYKTTNDFILGLITHGVSAMSYDIYGNSPLQIKRPPLIDISNGNIEAYHILTEQEGGTMPLTLSGKVWAFDPGKYYLGNSITLSEACGSGLLIIAVQTQNRERVLSLLADHPKLIQEHNVFGHNALFVAAHNNSLHLFPELLGAAKAASLLDKAAIDMDKVIFEAIDSTDRHCLNGRSNVECTQCSCSDSLALLLYRCTELLTSDVSVTLCEGATRASKRGQRIGLQYVKIQRENLKEIALSNDWALRDFQHILTSNDVLDIHATQVSTLLQQNGVQVPAHLIPQSTLGLYSVVGSTSVAEQLFELGFRDTDYDSSYGKQPLRMTYSRHSYALWLLEHGANPKRKIKLQGTFRGEYRWITIANFIMSNLGYWSSYTPANEARLNVWSRITAATISTGISNCCLCGCSQEGGCTPIINYLRTRRNYQGSLGSNFHRLLQKLSMEEARSSYVSFVRFKAFNTLGLTHTCCKFNPYNLECDGIQTMDEEETLEIHNEEHDLLARLDAMVIEFEREIKEVDNMGVLQDCTDNFLESYVPTVLEELEQERLTEEDRQNAEAIGVEWESDGDEEVDMDDDSDSSSVWTEENWKSKWNAFLADIEG